jgi:tetratricopeptide (TPR) repeat protein
MSDELKSADRLRRDGKVEEAIATYEAARGKGMDAKVAYEIGLTHATFRTDHEKALGYFTEALERDPGLADALFYRGLSLKALSRHEEAIRDLDAAERAGYKVEHIAGHRGEAFEQLGDFERAEQEYSRGIELSREDEWLHYRRATVRIRLGRERDALADLDRAIDLTQDYRDQELFQERAELKFKLGDVEGGRLDLQIADEAAKDLPDSVRIQAGIRARLDDFRK